MHFRAFSDWCAQLHEFPLGGPKKQQKTTKNNKKLFQESSRKFGECSEIFSMLMYKNERK